MPELPEVETIRRSLEADLLNATFSGVEVLFEKSMPEAGEVLIDEHIIGLRRRGKVLVLDISNGVSLLVHLKMTGQLILERPDGERNGGGHPTSSMANTLPDKSTRVVFDFTNGTRLFFNDQRKFGWIKVVPSSRVDEDSLLARMGVEPLGAEFTAEHLSSRLGARNAPIKAVLLDQSTLAGLGNIYVDEALHLARIHPMNKASSLQSEEVSRLHAAIVEILTSALAHDGTTFSDYLNPHGEKGNYLAHARVFNRTGLACPECGETIVKLKVAGRGTHICPQCQSLSS